MALSSMFLPPFPSKPSTLTSSLQISNQTRVFPKILATNITRPCLKSRLKQGKQLHGMLLFSASPTMAEIAAIAGYDVVIIDLEHGPGDVMDALHCIRAVKASGSSSVIRIPEITSGWTKKALDLGPDGIMFPKIETAKDAAYAVSLCRYPPKGVRGCAYTLVRDSSFGFAENYLQEYYERLMIMCQVETAKGVKNIYDIIAIEGVDCITSGPRDLSATLGLLDDPGSKNVREVLVQLEKAVKASDPAKGGAFLAGMATPQDSAVEMKKRGYDIVLGASDISMFTKAAIHNVKAFEA